MGSLQGGRTSLYSKRTCCNSRNTGVKKAALCWEDILCPQHRADRRDVGWGSRLAFAGHAGPGQVCWVTEGKRRGNREVGRLLRLVDAEDSWQVFVAPVILERPLVSLLISWG